MQETQENHDGRTTVAFATLGCKANQYDSSFLEAQLRARRFRLVDFKEKADIYIINTCTVTDRADLDSRNLIRRAARRNPEAFKIATGCYAQTKPGEVARVEGVDLVLGNDKKARLLDYLELGRPERPMIEVDDIFRQTELETFGMASYSKNTRAFVKIQDGCNQFCTFCIIPYARGRNRSIPIPRVLEELRSLSERGFREAVLTGIHIGTYGHDREPATSLLELLRAIEATQPIHRVRVSSIDPEEVSEEMVELFAGSRVLCPHLHIPLQAGDDEILRLMRRRYTVAEFAGLCERLAAKIPRLCIGTDVIVGFPYEDEARFENTYALLRDGPVHYFHVFPFSPKRGTKAAQMLGQVPPTLKKAHAARLRALSEVKSAEFRARFVGEEVEVLLERAEDVCQNGGHSEAVWTGFSENYLPVAVTTDSGFSGKLVRCRLEAKEGGNLAGKDQPGREKTAEGL
ncbi:tRNA (N(6)-L-threonylcarbamoyladenosine(37)-C(2))-methylthiotransferase MtaB [Deltaproteobacteria bacterium PRO3]|nr:tRNA (N(6)-L-threonylcarbamoyladenosine(37)-C(2))-methylthiotransferase MtaB [Deltaproteobacteria bacterium PRO3]